MKWTSSSIRRLSRHERRHVELYVARTDENLKCVKERTRLKHLILGDESGDNFNQPVLKLRPGGVGLTTLSFGDAFNQPLAPDAAPDGLLALWFGDAFNQPLTALPAGMNLLRFGRCFNQPLPALPAGLQRLVFGKDFNQPLPSLPAGLKYLEFGDNFNQPLPAGLMELRDFNKPLLHTMFNRSVRNLPAGLTSLRFGRNFNQPVRDLPAGLTIGLAPASTSPWAQEYSYSRVVGTW
jgi:hypothetical protein